MTSYSHPAPPADAARIASLERATFEYFRQMSDDTTGLVRDNTCDGSPATIAGSGFALACYAVAAHRGFVTRPEAIRRVLTALRFLLAADQSSARDATGHRGFFYHFLDPHTGRRHGKSELSTVDSGILFAGALVAAAYFQGGSAEEQEIRDLADALYRRVDWTWAVAPDGALLHGWRPERGFLPYGWCGYNEALFLYVLALGSPTHPIPAESYARWTSTYRWKRIYGHDFLYAGPLFIHQLSHIWIDFRGIQDAFMRSRGIDYFENSRRATYVHREYARRNPRGFRGYDEWSWGITASDGPGPGRLNVDGIDWKFYPYRARGVPFGADDGTLSPWCVAASLPFAPEIVLPTLQHLDETRPDTTGKFGYKCSFNPSFPVNANSVGPAAAEAGWIARGHYAIDQGPVVLMIENYRSELIWQLLRGCPYLVEGLARAGFTGGWLNSAS